MKNTKFLLNDIDLYDYHRIQEKLTALAAEGWHLQKLTNLYWKLRRGEPKAVRYEVTYSAAASAYDSEPTQEEKDLAALCAEAGWELAASYAQVQVYRNEDPNATPLETDEVQKYRNIRRNMLWHYFPRQILSTAVFLMLFLLYGSSFLDEPAAFLSSAMAVLVLIASAEVVIQYTAELTGVIAWLRRARRAAESGLTIPPNTVNRRLRRFRWAGGAVYLLALVFWVEPVYGLTILILTPVMLAISLGTLAVTKRLGASWKVNFWVPALLSVAVILLTLPLISDALTTPEAPAELPLTLTHLTGEKSDGKLTIGVSSSHLVSHGWYYDFGLVNEIQYTLADVHCPLFYDMIRNDFEQDFVGLRDYVGSTPVSDELRELIGADYIHRSTGTLNDHWMICWEDRILCLYANWPLTDQQLAIIAAQLRP